MSERRTWFLPEGTIAEKGGHRWVLMTEHPDTLTYQKVWHLIEPEGSEQ